MLKAKQISNISECARSFYLVSSKLGSSDAIPYTYSEDESYSRGRPSSLVRSERQTKLSSYNETRKASGFLLSGSHDFQASPVHLGQSSRGWNSTNAYGKDGSLDTGNARGSSLNLVHVSESLAGDNINDDARTFGLPSNIRTYGISNTNSGGPLPLLVCKDSYSNPVSKTDTDPSTSISNKMPSRKTVARSLTKKAIQQKSNPSSHDKHVDRIEGSASQNTKNNSDRVFKENMVSPSKCKPHQPVKCSDRKGFISTVLNPVELFSNKLRGLQWSSRSGSALSNLHCRLNPFQANQVLKQLKDHSLALGFFNWLKSQQGFAHDQHTYTTMIGILGQARQFDSAMQLLEEMTRSGCHPNVVTYNRLINGYGRANYIGEAMKLFYKMQDEGCRPDRVTFSTLIDVHAKSGYLEVAMDLHRQMLQVGLSPDTFTYSVIIDCLGKAGFLVSAYNLFWEMIANGCIPNLVTYNIIITMQAKARNYHSALTLYQNLRDFGFRPDKITYSIVMEVLGQCGHLDDVEMLFMEMKRDCIPDEQVYGLLIDLWGKAGNPDKARGWYCSMLESGLRPNVPTCNSLLGAFLRVNRFSDARDVLEKMLKMKLQPSLQTYTMLLSCCTEAHADLKSCGQLMEITGHPAHLFLQSMPNAEPGGLNVKNHVGTFLDMMHCEDRESKRGLVDAVVDFLHKSDHKEEAGWVWDTAASRNLYPDAVREKWPDYWLINLHVMSDGTAITALSRSLSWIRMRMHERGRGPVRVDIVTGWGKRSRVTGTSLVRQAVSNLLYIFHSPFYTENGNSGCFVACGMSLQAWLLQSYVERMHLL